MSIIEDLRQRDDVNGLALLGLKYTGADLGGGCRGCVGLCRTVYGYVGLCRAM